MLLDRYYCLPAASYYQDDCPDADEGRTRAALTIATLSGIDHRMVAGCQVPNSVMVPSLAVS